LPVAASSALGATRPYASLRASPGSPARGPAGLSPTGTSLTRQAPPA